MNRLFFNMGWFVIAVIGSMSATAQVVANDLRCDGCVMNQDLSNWSIDKTKIRGNSITRAKIVNGAVSFDKLNAQLRSRITELEDQIMALRDQLDSIQSNSVLALDGYLSLNLSNGVTVLVEGANLQVTNGTGSTGVRNGRGNLIVGYDEPRAGGTQSCSQGEFMDESACIANGAVWQRSHKSGSHNLVVGAQHNYSSTGGAVLGYENNISNYSAVVTGGWMNSASGQYTSVSGGLENSASGLRSSVCGGWKNSSESDQTSVSGGVSNRAVGRFSSVSGGSDNVALGEESSVSGGLENQAAGSRSSVSGGYQNEAESSLSTVSGGNRNRASGRFSSVSGGSDRSTNGGDDDWAAGSLFEDN